VNSMGSVMSGRELDDRSVCGSLSARRCHLVTYMLVEYIVIGVAIVAFLKISGLVNDLNIFIFTCFLIYWRNFSQRIS